MRPLEGNWGGRLEASPAAVGILALTGQRWELGQAEVPMPESVGAQLLAAVAVAFVCLGFALGTGAPIALFAEQHQLGYVRTCFVLC